MTTQTVSIKGMHCASCAAVITKKISDLPHVHTISVNYATEKAVIDYDETEISLASLQQSITPYGYTLQATQTEEQPSSEQKPIDAIRDKVAFMLPLTITMIILMTWDTLANLTTTVPNLPLPMELFNTIGMILASIVLWWIGIPYLRAVIRFARYGVANMDTLIGIGTGTAYFYSVYVTLFALPTTPQSIPLYTYFDVTIVVLGFITLGNYLEAQSKKKTGSAIAALFTLQAKTALVLRNGSETEIPIEQVKHGDSIIVKPGARIPVDGIVTEGVSFVDESMITGESMPVHKQQGDAVVAGTINTTGSFTCTTTRIGSETMLAHIIAMVEKAQNSKAPIQALADTLSGIFVPVVLGIAILTYIAWITIGAHFIGISQALSYGLTSFVGVLIIACPCALGLATPTAIIVGVGKGAREGILIKDAATLETLHNVTTLVMDKTGTITKGTPTITSIEPLSTLTETELISIIASLEKKSEHPIAHAIMTYATAHTIPLFEVTDFEALRGKGIRGTINNELYTVGNVALIEELGHTFSSETIPKATSEGKTPLLLATSTTVLGIVHVADEIKEYAKETITALKNLGITVIMLTGDDIRTATYIASQVGIDRVIAHSTPETKLTTITSLQSSGNKVAMVGDGSNDAPALAQANVGIAMATGTDIAIESSGITLLSGDISKIPSAFRLSKHTMQGIRQNLFWAFIYNIIGIPLAAGIWYPITGWVLNPIFAGSAMALSSVSVIVNSLRISRKKI